MTSGFRSPWSGAVRPAPLPASPDAAPSPRPASPTPRPVADEPLTRQIAHALVDETEARQLTLREFSALTGVGLSSVRAHRYGQGLRVDTLQKYAEALGWRIAIIDANGQELGRV